MEVRLTNRKKQALQTKKILFQTAVRLFNERGFEEVTVEEITRAAGFAKGSFYTYFRSKSDILIEEFRDIDNYYRDYRSELIKHEMASQRLLVFTRAQLRYVQDHVGLKLLKLLYINTLESQELEEDLIDTNRYLHTLIHEVMDYGQERKEFREDMDSQTLAMYFNRGMRAMFLHWAVSNGNFNLVDEGMKYCRTMLIPSITLIKA